MIALRDNPRIAESEVSKVISQLTASRQQPDIIEQGQSKRLESAIASAAFKVAVGQFNDAPLVDRSANNTPPSGGMIVGCSLPRYGEQRKGLKRLFAFRPNSARHHTAASRRLARSRAITRRSQTRSPPSQDQVHRHVDARRRAFVVPATIQEERQQSPDWPCRSGVVKV